MAFLHRQSSCVSASVRESGTWWVPDASQRSSTVGAALDEEILTWAARYEGRFGRPFLIRRRGRSREEIVAQLQIRIRNNDESEDRAIAHELRQIAVLALSKRVQQ